MEKLEELKANADESKMRFFVADAIEDSEKIKKSYLEYVTSLDELDRYYQKHQD